MPKGMAIRSRAMDVIPSYGRSARAKGSMASNSSSADDARIQTTRKGRPGPGRSIAAASMSSVHATG